MNKEKAKLEEVRRKLKSVYCMHLRAYSELLPCDQKHSM
jgi:hypothetical protein